MSDNATSAQGTVFYIGDGGGPETFNAVGDIKALSGLQGGSPTILDPTDLDSTFRLKAVGLLDEGQIRIGGNWVPDTDTYQAQMRTDRAAKTLRNCRIIFSNGEQADFAGYITTLAVNADVDTLLDFDSTIEISGAVTWS